MINQTGGHYPQKAVLRHGVTLATSDLPNIVAVGG